MTTTGKYFPIQTATSCQLKWNWSTIRLYNGITSSCHRVSGDMVDVDNFDSFHNTPTKVAGRKLMLDGQWPTGGCEYCKKIEDAGGSSDRMFHLQIPDQSPPELETDPTALDVTPRILEIYFDNVCNMSCLYCNASLSSKIEQENIKHGKFEQHGVVIENRANKVPDIDALTDKFWQWMQQNSIHLRRLHILGGEPFYQAHFDQCLDFLNTHSNPDLEFNVVSNLMITTDKFQKQIKKIHELVKNKSIKRFDLTVSIDCFGPEQEYVRYGLDLEQWKKNFEYVVAQDWIVLNINQTLTVLTIKTMPELLQYVNSFRSSREIGHYFSTVVKSQECLHPEIFGSGFFDQDFEKILSIMPDTTWQDQHAKIYMKGIKSQFDSMTRNQNSINQLGIFLTEIDRRRNLNWRKTFPWLTKEIQSVV